MFLEAVERLYSYQRESNNHLFKVASRISHEQFTDVIVEGQPSIRDTLFHMVDVIESHFEWWNFNTDQVRPVAKNRHVNQFPDAPSIKNYWTEVDQYVAECIASLDSNEQLDRTFERGFDDGSSNKRKIWEMLLHVINHGTQHRSEVAMMLTKLGHSPGDMEILEIRHFHM